MLLSSLARPGAKDSYLEFMVCTLTAIQDANAALFDEAKELFLLGGTGLGVYELMNGRWCISMMMMMWLQHCRFGVHGAKYLRTGVWHCAQLTRKQCAQRKDAELPGPDDQAASLSELMAATLHWAGSHVHRIQWFNTLHLQYINMCVCVCVHVVMHCIVKVVLLRAHFLCEAQPAQPAHFAEDLPDSGLVMCSGVAPAVGVVCFLLSCLLYVNLFWASQ